MPSLKKDLEYKWNCIDEMPNSKYWLCKYDWDYDNNDNDNKTKPNQKKYDNKDNKKEQNDNNITIKQLHKTKQSQ